MTKAEKALRLIRDLCDDALTIEPISTTDSEYIKVEPKQIPTKEEILRRYEQWEEDKRWLKSQDWFKDGINRLIKAQKKVKRIKRRATGNPW